MKTLIIAEAGVNHNGSLELAKELVTCAARLGADIVKFQTFTASELATKSAPKAAYQKQSSIDGKTQFEMLKSLELTRDDHFELRLHCDEHNIEFLSTAFDIQSLQLLQKLKLKRFKIPSGEITNLPYLRHVGSIGKPVILSTGMATLGEIDAAIQILEKSGTKRRDISVLHCNTEYPTPFKDVNLKAMLTIKEAFQVPVGYSDHTAGIDVAVASVALGATIIEKHLTLDRSLPGPDHMASIEPSEFAKMVESIRNIEQALGNGIKRPSNSELSNIHIVRKSIVAAMPIKIGEKFTDKNICVKRPGTGISPMRWDEVVGRIATRDYFCDDLIEV